MPISKKRTRRPTVAAANKPARPLPPPEAVTNLAALEAIYAEPVKVHALVGSKVMFITGRRLTPAENEPVTAWMQRAQPKRLPPEKPGGPERLDLEEADYPGGYPARKEHCWRMARSIALWAAYPLFRETALSEGQVVKTQEEIRHFIEARNLPNDLLDALFQALTRDEVNAVLGFT